MPSFAKKFVGDEIKIVQRETWTSATAADLHVSIPGKPGEHARHRSRSASHGDGTDRDRAPATSR